MDKNTRIEKLRALKEDMEATLKALKEQKKAKLVQESKSDLEKLFEGELERAGIIFNAKEMCDKLQKMAEDLAKMQADAMPIVDNMKGVFGPDVADQFEAATKEQLEATLNAVRSAKDALNTQVLRMEGKISDEDVNTPSNDMTDAALGGGGEEKAAPADDEAELDSLLGTEGGEAEGGDESLDDLLGGDEAASGPANEPLGRAKKESFVNDASLIIEGEAKDCEEDDCKVSEATDKNNVGKATVKTGKMGQYQGKPMSTDAGKNKANKNGDGHKKQAGSHPLVTSKKNKNTPLAQMKGIRESEELTMDKAVEDIAKLLKSGKKPHEAFKAVIADKDGKVKKGFKTSEVADAVFAKYPELKKKKTDESVSSDVKKKSDVIVEFNEGGDDFPFDRPHWLVSVSFSAEHLAQKDAIEHQLEMIAASRGGSPYMSSSSSTDFGFSYAFEAGDANTNGFIHLVQSKLAGFNPEVTFDAEDVTYPAEESAVVQMAGQYLESIKESTDEDKFTRIATKLEEAIAADPAKAESWLKAKLGIVEAKEETEEESEETEEKTEEAEKSDETPVQESEELVEWDMEDDTWADRQEAAKEEAAELARVFLSQQDGTRSGEDMVVDIMGMLEDKGLPMSEEEIERMVFAAFPNAFPAGYVPEGVESDEKKNSLNEFASLGISQEDAHAIWAENDAAAKKDLAHRIISSSQQPEEVKNFALRTIEIASPKGIDAWAKDNVLKTEDANQDAIKAAAEIVSTMQSDPKMKMKLDQEVKKQAQQQQRQQRQQQNQPGQDGDEETGPEIGQNGQPKPGQGQNRQFGQSAVKPMGGTKPAALKTAADKLNKAIKTGGLNL